MPNTPPSITRFRGEYFFLSNFYDYPTPSVEHYFQSMKTVNMDERQWVLDAESPSQAKARGRRVALRPNWDSYSYHVMRDLIAVKFALSAPFSPLLLRTQDAELIEGNTWNDRRWGAVWDAQKQSWEGENLLGKLLMERRAFLQTMLYRST